MSTEEVKNNDGGPQTNGDVVIPQERVKRPTRPDDVAQKAAIDELQASSTSIVRLYCGPVECGRDLIVHGRITRFSWMDGVDVIQCIFDVCGRAVMCFVERWLCE